METSYDIHRQIRELLADQSLAVLATASRGAWVAVGAAGCLWCLGFRLGLGLWSISRRYGRSQHQDT